MLLILKNEVKTRLIYILLLIIVLLSISPIIWMFLASIKTTAQMFAYPPVIIPPKPTLNNYRAILFGADSKLPFLINSLIISLITTVIVMAIATPASFSFAKMKIKGGKNMEFWILSTRMMPPIAVLIPLSLIIRKLALFDTKLGVILVYVAFNLPYAVWMMTIFFR